MLFPWRRYAAYLIVFTAVFFAEHCSPQELRVNVSDNHRLSVAEVQNENGFVRSYESTLGYFVSIQRLDENGKVDFQYRGTRLALHFTLPLKRRAVFSDLKIQELIQQAFVKEFTGEHQKHLLSLMEKNTHPWFQNNGAGHVIHLPINLIVNSDLKASLSDGFQSFRKKIDNLNKTQPRQFKGESFVGKLKFVGQDIRKSETWRTTFVRHTGNSFLPVFFAYLATVMQPDQFQEFSLDSFQILMVRAVVLASLSSGIQLFRSSFYGYMSDTAISNRYAKKHLGEDWSHDPKYRRMRSFEFGARWFTIQIGFVLLIDSLTQMITGEAIFAGTGLSEKFLTMEHIANWLKLAEFSAIGFLAQKSFDEVITDYEKLEMPKHIIESDKKLFRAKISDYYSYVAIFANAMTYLAMFASEHSGFPVHWIAATGVYAGGVYLHKNLQNRMDKERLLVNHKCGLLF